MVSRRPNQRSENLRVQARSARHKCKPSVSPWLGVRTSVWQDSVTEKSGGTLVQLTEKSLIDGAKGVRPHELVKFLVNGELEILITARKRQGERFIGKAPIQEAQVLGCGIALDSLEQTGPVPEEHVGGAVEQALDSGVIAVHRKYRSGDLESISALPKPVNDSGIGHHREGLLRQQGPGRGSAPYRLRLRRTLLQDVMQLEW